MPAGLKTRLYDVCFVAARLQTRHLLPRVIVMRAVDDVLEIAIVTARRLLELLIGDPHHLWFRRPRFHQH